MRRLFTIASAAVLLGAAAAPPALAIRPGQFIQTTEADFEPGENDNTVVTNLGDIKLATGITSLAELGEDASVIYDVAAIGDTIYLAAGPEGKLFKRVGDETTEVAALPNEQVFCLAQYGGKLLAGVSGKTSRLAELNDAGELVTIIELPDARYVWDIVVSEEEGPNPPVYVATGTEGVVYRVALGEDGQPAATPILDANQANILCLSMLNPGVLYAGADTDGLIYRLTANPDAETGFDSFVVFDAPEPEIGALLVLPDGTLYAGTADADQARPGRLGELVEEEVGRVAPAEAPAGEGEAEPEQPPAPDDLPEVPPAPEETAAPAEAAEAAAVAPTEAAPADQPAAAVPAQEEDEAADAQSEEEGEPDAEPTPEQRDRLRELVRARLEAARKSGALSAGPSRPGSASARPARRAQGGAPQEGPKEGNAVYRIDPEGFVAEVFRESVMILSIVNDDGQLIVATGNEGQVFRVDPSNNEMTIIADVEPEQVPALLLTPKGVLMGAANPAELLLLTGETATSGAYSGPILDAGQVSLWGAMHLTADIPAGASVAVATRSGNVEDPEEAPWSKWSDPITLEPQPDASPLQPRQLEVKAPPARFLQYRLTLTGGDGQTPVVGRVATAYVTPNLRPVVSTFKAAYPEPTPPQPGQEETEASPNMTVEWEASDPNGDRLLFTLAYQPAGAERWIDLASDLDALTYEWNTRRAPDGWYLLRVTASDKLDNPPDMVLTAHRRSAPVLVDTTAPTLEDVKAAVAGRAVTLSGTAVDAFSPIQSIAYVVDDAEFYEPILPTDLIFDSTREAWSVTISDLSPGDHVIILRVADVRGNTGYHAKIVNIRP